MLPSHWPGYIAMLPLNVEDQISSTKVFRTTTKPLTPNAVPAAGTINRCPHGVYIPAGDVTAPYCTYCTPGGPKNQRPVVLPRSSADPLNVSDRVGANKKVEGACTQCGSTVYMRANEKGSDANRVCADCGHKYRARVPKTFKELAAEAGVSFDE